MSFGETLKNIRKKHKDSLATLAEKLGVAYSYIDRVEKGSAISEKIFTKLLEVYQEDEDELNLSYLEKTVPEVILDKLMYKNDKLTVTTPTMKAQKFKTYIVNSLGDGSLLSDYKIKELIIPMGLSLKKNNFCIEIEGDELEPIFYENDTLLIEETSESWQELNKKIVVIEKGDNRILRKVEIVNYEPLFFSLNNIYPPFPLDKEMKLLGKVTNLLSRNLEKIKF